MNESKFTRRDFLKGSIAGLLLSAGAGSVVSRNLIAGNKKRPNIVFILIDDLGWRDVSYMGSKFYETPAIDKLAKDGVVFTDAYQAGPRCVASRMSIMTGKYHYRPGIKEGHNVRLEEVTMAEALKEGGYSTFFAGKWHLGGKGYYPEDQGFDVNIGGCEYGSTPSHFYPYSTPEMPAPHNLVGGKEGEYLTDRLTDEAIKFIKNHQKKEPQKPFFVFLSHYAVHTPFEAKEKYVKKYKEKLKKMDYDGKPDYIIDYTGKVKMKQDNYVYAAMIQSVDDSVKKIRKALKDMKLDKNTVIVFTSDNGGLSTTKAYGRRKLATSNYPLRTGKGWLYEGGDRIPLIVYWPGVTKAGTVTHSPVVGTDFYPTLLEIAGLPLKPEQHKDGRSFVPILKGKKYRREPIYWYYTFAKMGTGNPSMASVRDGDYKLVEFLYTKEVELYNIAKDPGETKNLASKMPAKVKKMLKMLHDWEDKVGVSPLSEKNKRVNKKLLNNLKKKR